MSDGGDSRIKREAGLLMRINVTKSKSIVEHRARASLLAVAFAYRQCSQRCELLIGETRSFKRNDRGRREIGEREREREKERERKGEGERVLVTKDSSRETIIITLSSILPTLLSPPWR